MNITHIATTARLSLSEQEATQLEHECEEILAMFSTLAQVDTHDVEPAFRPVESGQVFREDVVEESLTQEQALRNVKQTEEGFVIGPRTV